jgi:hypothetical protein
MVLSQLPPQKFDRAYIVNGGFDLGSADAAIRHKGQSLCIEALRAVDFGLDAATNGGLDEPAAVAIFQVMPIGTPGEPVAPTIGTGVKT